jgi:hypothetical protein
MLYLVIERFLTPGGVEVYRRARDCGRLMPDGVEYVASWVTPDFTMCYQVMRARERAALDEWIAAWSDLVAFEVKEVISSAEAMALIAPRL